MLLLLFLLQACEANQDAQADADAQRTHIMAVFNAYTEAINAAQYDAAVQHYADTEAFQWFEDGRLRYSSRAEVRSALDEVAQYGDVKTRFGEADITILGKDHALLSAAFDTQIGDPIQGGFRFSGIMTITLAQIDNEWKFLKGHTSSKQEREDEHEITLKTSDGVDVYGDLHTVVEGKSAPLILLFHQGAANARAEYSAMIPVLLAEGYNVLAIDQRRGGDRLGGTNRTVDELEASEFGYCDVYPDLEAALTYVKEQGYTGKRIAWGSSYSATLAIQLAAKNPDDIQGTLAFSPASGDPMEGCRPESYLGNLSSALLVLRPQRETEIESVQQQLKMFKEAGHRTYVAANGVHGSSMLNPERVEGSVDPQWQIVLRFIEEVL